MKVVWPLSACLLIIYWATVSIPYGGTSLRFIIKQKMNAAVNTTPY